MKIKHFLNHLLKKLDRCFFTLVDLGMKCVQVRVHILLTDVKRDKKLDVLFYFKVMLYKKK